MSFRTTKEVLETFRDRFAQAERWSADVAEDRGEDPAFVTAAGIVTEELRARALSFQAAIDAAETKTLNTYLQYEPQIELRQATEALITSEPPDVESLFTAVANFYRVVFEGLSECGTTTEGTPASAVFAELEREVEAGVSFQTWKMRSQA